MKEEKQNWTDEPKREEQKEVKETQKIEKIQLKVGFKSGQSLTETLRGTTEQDLKIYILKIKDHIENKRVQIDPEDNSVVNWGEVEYVFKLENE